MVILTKILCNFQENFQTCLDIPHRTWLIFRNGIERKFRALPSKHENSCWEQYGTNPSDCQQEHWPYNANTYIMGISLSSGSDIAFSSCIFRLYRGTKAHTTATPIKLVIVLAKFQGENFRSLRSNENGRKL